MHQSTSRSVKTCLHSTRVDGADVEVDVVLFRPADAGGRLGVEGEVEVNGVDTAGRCGGLVSV